MTRNDMYHRAMLRQLGVTTYQESPHGKATAVDHKLEHSGERAAAAASQCRMPPAGASGTPGDGTSGSGTS